MTVERDIQATASLSRRFQLRMIELAKQGVFGSLKTRHPGLQSAYSHLLSLLDNPEVPLLFYGEKGSGKRRHVDELVQMHNFSRKIEGQSPGRLKVFRGDFVSPGFSQLLSAPSVSECDVIYMEAIDLMSTSCQEEFLGVLKQRKIFSDKGLPLPRLILGTEQALSVLIICGEFNRELFQAISGFAVFLPTLQERSEDVPQLLKSFGEEITGQPQTPPTWLVDFVAKREWAANIDELQKMLRSGLTRKPELAKWTTLDLPLEMQPRRPVDFNRDSDEVQRYQRAMVACAGDRRSGAIMVGVPYGEFLEKLLVLGIR